jgi:hypothetical protein
MQPVLQVAALFSRHADALAWAEERLTRLHGPLALTSPTYDFNQTTYYQQQMGPDLRKRIVAFERLVPPDCLADLKRDAIRLEAELASSGRYAESRPINIDPGILTVTKLVLATTKDQIHRIYLRDGILAEVTLSWIDGEYRPWPWTYIDYQQPAVLDFFKQVRGFLRGQGKE